MRTILHLLLCLGLFAIVGCPTGDDDDSAGSDDDDTADDDDSAAAADCGTFCTDLFATCTGANEQFGGDIVRCENDCPGWPLGVAGDTAGDSFACRDYHLGAAAGDPALHCPHAGGQAVCVP